MNSKFLETFVELARTPQLRRVADRMHSTPSTISMRIRSLEQDLGVKLFEKTQNALVLTDTGRRLRPYAEAVLRTVGELSDAAQQSGAISGRVRVGIIETVVLTLLPDFMIMMRERYAGIEIDLTVDITTNLIRKLGDGELDLIVCIGVDPIGPHFVTENLLALRHLWVAKRELLRPNAEIADIFMHPIMTQISNSSPYNATVSHIQQMATLHAIPLSELRITSTPSLAALVSLAKEGLGVAILPGLLVREELHTGTLVQLSLPEPRPMMVSQWSKVDARPVIGYVAEVVRATSAEYFLKGGMGDLATLESETAPGVAPVGPRRPGLQ